MNTDTILAAFDTWQTTRGWSPHTVRRRRLSIGTFARHIHPCTLDKATGEQIDEWLGRYRSPATRHAYLSDLSTFYKWAVRRKLCRTNPAAMVDRVRVPKTLPRPVDPALIRTIVGLAGDYELRVMVALAAYAGLRISEIAALDMTDVVLGGTQPHMVVRNGKGRKDRIVPLHPELVRLLSARRTGPVVSICSKSVGRRITEHLHACGVPASAHKLRASFATELARVTSGNVPMVAAVLGHESIATSMIYIRVAQSADGTHVAGMYPEVAA